MPTGQQYSSTAAQEQLVGNITNVSPTATITGTTGLPGTPFTGVWEIGTANQEVVDVTNVSGNVITQTRGVDGSAAQAHNNGATFTHSAIGRDFREARSHMDASGSGSGTTVHGLANGSNVVGTTDTQTLTNKTLTNPTVNGLNVNNATITGTVSGGATYTAPIITSPSITGTVSGAATYSAPTITNPDVTGTVTGDATYIDLTIQNDVISTPPLIVNGISGVTASLQQWNNNGNQVAAIGSTGNLTSPAANITGLTGATTASRYVGATTQGPPASGTFNTGDYVVDLTGTVWICTAGGTSGTWSPQASKISKITLGAPAATIDFTSIPQNFSSLLFVFKVKSASTSGSATADNLAATINGVSSANYNNALSAVNNTGTVSGAAAATQTVMELPAIWNSFGSNTAGAGEGFVLFPHYTDTSFCKMAVALGYATDGAGTSGLEMAGGALNVTISTSAISRVTFSTKSGSSFVTGSSIELIGLP